MLMVLQAAWVDTRRGFSVSPHVQIRSTFGGFGGSQSGPESCSLLSTATQKPPSSRVPMRAQLFRWAGSLGEPAARLALVSHPPPPPLHHQQQHHPKTTCAEKQMQSSTGQTCLLSRTAELNVLRRDAEVLKCTQEGSAIAVAVWVSSLLMDTKCSKGWVSIIPLKYSRCIGAFFKAVFGFKQGNLLA